MGPHTMIQLLKDRAEAVQTIFRELPGLDDAFQYAITVTRRQQGHNIAAPRLAAEDQRRFAGMCRENGLTLLTTGLRSHVEAIDTGFTMADWAIAETATVVLDSSPEDVRIATTLSEIHVAVVPRCRIRRQATDLITEFRAAFATPPGYLAFISGASRTADIERILTIGVHGPRELHLVIVTEEPA
jgi:L-lactate dehydrogenase complex protein LldG